MNKKHSPATVSALLVGSTLASIYAIQALLSRDSSGYDLIQFLTGFAAAAAVVLGYWYWLYRHKISLSFKIVFFWACVFRLIGVWGEPILEDDFYRYLLDACLFLTYGSPYGITPESLFVDNSLSPACEAMLSGVNNPHLATIYAPVLQFVFAASYLVSPVNLDVLQLLIVLFDMAVIGMLGRLAPARMVLLYAWCPLVIKEFAFTAHPDVIGVCLLLAAFMARKSGYRLSGAVLMGLACCTKILAVVALPFFLFRQPARYWLVIIATIVAMYLPFLLKQPKTDLATLVVFATDWLFNAPVFSLLKVMLTDSIARFTSVGVFLLWYSFYFVRYDKTRQPTDIPRMDWIFGVLFVLSPVLNAWYWVWVLPFAVLWPSLWAWTASVALVLSYVIGLHLPDSNLDDYQVSQLAQTTQLLSIGCALVIDYRYRRFRMTGVD